MVSGAADDGGDASGASSAQLRVRIISSRELGVFSNAGSCLGCLPSSKNGLDPLPDRFTSIELSKAEPALELAILELTWRLSPPRQKHMSDFNRADTR